MTTKLSLGEKAAKAAARSRELEQDVLRKARVIEQTARDKLAEMEMRSDTLLHRIASDPHSMEIVFAAGMLVFLIGFALGWAVK